MTAADRQGNRGRPCILLLVALERTQENLRGESDHSVCVRSSSIPIRQGCSVSDVLGQSFEDNDDRVG